MQNYQRNTCKYPNPETPAKKKRPRPETKLVTTDISISPNKQEVRIQNCVNGKPKLANII